MPTLADDTDTLTVRRGTRTTFTTRHHATGLFTVASCGALPDFLLDTEDGLILLTEDYRHLETAESVTNFTVRGRVGRVTFPRLTLESGGALLTETRGGILGG